MSFRQRSVTYVKSFLRAFTREKRYPTCFKFRFVSSPLLNCETAPLLVPTFLELGSPLVFGSEQQLRLKDIVAFVHEAGAGMNRTSSPLQSLYGAAARMDGFGLYPIADMGNVATPFYTSLAQQCSCPQAIPRVGY
jgi:hypothetical protein